MIASRLYYDLVDLDKFDIKDESGVGRNDGWETTGTISVIGSASKLGTLTNRQLGDTWYIKNRSENVLLLSCCALTFIPATDDLANTNLASERLVTITRRVKLFTTLQSASVVNGDSIASLGEVLAITRSNSFNTCIRVIALISKEY